MSKSAGAARTAGAAQSIPEMVAATVERALLRNIKGLEYLTSSDPPTACTPRDTIYASGTLKLYHYRPVAPELYRVPVVLVMSLLSKAYIFDLAPGQSRIEVLVAQGYDVYLIDWGVPRPEDCRLRIENYVLDFIPECISRIAVDSGEPDVSVFGYCMGGQLSLMYAALHPGGPLKNLICLTTSINSEGMGLFRQWTDPRYFDVDKVVDTLGNVPAELLLNAFEMLRPVSKITSQIRLWDNIWNDAFVQSYRVIDRWASDQIPFAGECFRQMHKEVMWGNRLYTGELTLREQRVSLANIRVPLLAVMAEQDHIAPLAATRELLSLVGSEDKQEVLVKGGHVSVMAGPNAKTRLWQSVDRWLSERSV
jgi:polyhydroxyalkanoate synthase